MKVPLTLQHVQTLHTQVHMDGCHTNRIHDLHVRKTTYNMAGKTQMMAGIN